MSEVTGCGTLAGTSSPARPPFSYVVKGNDLEEDGLADKKNASYTGRISLIIMKGQTSTQLREYSGK